jgi:FkbM family methyltransferase
MNKISYTDEDINRMTDDYKHRRKKDVTVNLNGTDVSFSWPSNDRECFNILMHDWPNHNKVLDKYITDTGPVLMAGGNAGLYPFFYSLRFEKVYTFEPDILNFSCLVDNCASPNIIKFNTGLSDKNEFVGFHLTINNNGMCHVTDKKEQTAYQIFTMNIDSLNIDKLSLIHLDTEGCEYKIFKGAVKTIKRCRPVIISDLTLNEDKITELLTKYGYEKKEEYGIEKTAIFIPKE